MCHIYRIPLCVLVCCVWYFHIHKLDRLNIFGQVNTLIMCMHTVHSIMNIWIFIYSESLTINYFFVICFLFYLINNQIKSNYKSFFFWNFIQVDFIWTIHFTVLHSILYIVIYIQRHTSFSSWCLTFLLSSVCCKNLYRCVCTAPNMTYYRDAKQIYCQICDIDNDEMNFLLFMNWIGYKKQKR